MKELSDLIAPAAIAVKPMLEAEVQSKCVAWARSRGYWARKFSSPSQRSVPDYLFAKPDLIFATEFKAPGKTSTDAQKDEQKSMRAAGWEVFECDDIGKFKTIVLQIENALP